MSYNKDLLFQLEEMLHWKKSKKFYAERLNITEEEVENLKKEIRKLDREEKNNEHLETIQHTRQVNVEKGTLESVVTLAYEPKDDIELAKLHNINLDKYIITNYWSKLLPSGKFTSSVFSKLKQPTDYSPEDFLKFLENYKPKDVEITKVSKNKELDTIDAELSISDYHLAKRYVNGNNNIQDRRDAFYNIAKNLITKVSNIYNLDTLVFPISNDFFHTDNYQNSTTNGTPQDVIMEFDSEYEVGFDLLVDTINLLRHFCNNVQVVLVQGNHDKTKSFYLAHALEVYFKNSKDVEFIRHHSTIKATVIGDTFIGYHHGNCKIDELPLLFATDPKYSVMFGNSRYKEVHTGDKHHYMAKEIKGVRIQQMPSLSDSDRWHKDNNFVNSIRAALLLGYDKKEGKVCEFEKRI